MSATDRELTVYAISPSTEVSTGENMYQVLLGEYIDVTPEILKTLPLQPAQTIPKQVAVFWLALNVKTNDFAFTKSAQSGNLVSRMMEV